jgi:hypothetical protein
MSISCQCDYDSDGADWFYDGIDDDAPLNTKRSRLCCSCHGKIKPGETARMIKRYRPPSDRCNYIEESIYGDEVPLANWYLCETCGDLVHALEERGLCFSINGNIQQQIKEAGGL